SVDPTAKQCVWLREETQTFQLTTASCPNWVFPNADAAGYYRFTLDNSLAQALQSDTAINGLSELEVMALVDAAMAAFASGDARVPELVGLIFNLSDSPYRHVSAAARDILGLIGNRMGLMSDEELAPVFRRL